MKTTSLLLLLPFACAQRQGPPGGGEQQGSGDVCAADGSSYSLSVTADTTTRTIATSGCPHYDYTSQSTTNEALEQSAMYKLPLKPVFCKESTPIGVYADKSETTKADNVIGGPVGVAFNGVALLGNADAEQDDAFVNEGHTFDQCQGHPSPPGLYHYHAEVPEDCLTEKHESGQHSPLFGFMADGIPIYGPKGDGGEVPDDLDECNGHTDETYGFYHYHVEPEYKYPYLINCLKGKVDQTEFSNFPEQNCQVDDTVEYDYSSLDDWNVGTSSTGGTTDDSSDATRLGAFSLLLLAALLLN